MLISYFLICVLLISIGLLGFFSINKIESSYGTILNTNFKKVILVGTLSSYSKDSNLQVVQIAAVAKLKSKLNDIESDYKSFVLKYTETKKIFDSLPTEGAETDIIKNLDTKWNTYTALSDKAFTLAKKLSAADSTNELETILNDDVDTARLELNDALARVAVFQKDAADNLSNESSKAAKKLSLISFSSVTLGTILSLVLGFLFSTSTSRGLVKIQKSLTTEANQIKNSSSLVTNNVISLQEKLGQQASGIQETVVACEQVSAMVAKTAEAARISDEKATASQRFVVEGTRSVADLSESINAINQSFIEIKNEVVESQKGIREVSNLINEIKSKTSVINEIVFQTKLLSFNASVEAARAGEHGKGFAVVAEEVGGLAKMSGDSATEINALIDRSSVRIVSIFDDMQKRIGTQLESGEALIASGRDKVTNCAEIFNSIQNAVTEVQSQVSASRAATTEQASGVSEINRAVTMIDLAAQENSVLAQDISKTTANFDSAVTELEQAVSSLTVLLSKKSHQLEV